MKTASSSSYLYLYHVPTAAITTTRTRTSAALHPRPPPSLSPSSSLRSLALRVATERWPPHHRPRTSQLRGGVFGNGRPRLGISSLLKSNYIVQLRRRFLTQKKCENQKCSDLKISFAVRTGRPSRVQRRRVWSSSPPGCAATALGWVVAHLY